MRRMYRVLGFVFVCLTSTGAYASGDYGCELPRGSVLFSGYDACDSVPFLSPSNDTRLNLELMLIDSGKLMANLKPEQTSEYVTASDFEPLRVPFDSDDLEVSEPGSGSATGSSGSTGGAPQSDYAEGEGSRCDSASGGLEAFKSAISAAAGLTKEEAAALIMARINFVVGCGASAAPGAKLPEYKLPDGLHSAMAHDFGAYLVGANAFYSGDYATAVKSFDNLKNSANRWVKETSRYMVGRTLLNGAQEAAFGEWGDLKAEDVNKDSLKGAEDGFNSYLRDFPRGTYTNSARGLLRRVYWLGGDETQLAEALDRALANTERGASNATVLDLVQESDAKLLATVKLDRIQSVRFLAIADLMQMRTGDSAGGAPPKASLKLSDLDAQKDRFASNPALYKYLLAGFHVYVDNKPEEALALLPDVPKVPLNYFAFSQQTLRVIALEAIKQYDVERNLVLAMLPLAKRPLEPEQLQLELARLEVLSAHTGQIFAPDSAVRDTAIRTIAVEYTASAEMLRQRVKDPKENAGVVNAALYSLLYKELTGAKYQAFQADLALLPPHPQELLAPFAPTAGGKDAKYPCPALRDVAASLQRDPNNAQGLNCIGELVRLHGVHYGQEKAPAATDLGGSGSLFPVTNYSRLDGYIRVIANTHADAAARSYALYRAVQCYAPSGYNDCGSQDIPRRTRNQWFDTLHKEYPDSTWAKSLKYYW
jgi:hypothetical protein